MKNLLFASLLMLGVQVVQAQFFSLGIKGGIHTQVNSPGEIFVGTGDQAFKLAVDKREFGTQFGAFLRLGGGIFVQPELLFNSNKVDYVIGESSVSQVIKNEKYQYLDMPLLLGVKFGPLRVVGGPVGHRFLHSRSELSDIDGYEAKFKTMTWGFQTGLNLGLGRFSIDARYEGNFNKQGNHINFNGTQYNFDHSPSRFIVGLNLAII